MSESTIRKRFGKCLLLKENERYNIFKHLSKVDYLGRLQHLIESRYPDTCTWLSDNLSFCAWRSSVESKGLCCRGIRKQLHYNRDFG